MKIKRKLKRYRPYHFMIVFCLCLGLCLTALGTFRLATKFAHAQNEADKGEKVNAPRPRFKTSGAVGVPASFHAPPLQAGVQAAALQSPNDWTPAFTEDFEANTLDSTRWQIFAQTTNDLEYGWGLDSSNAYSSTQSLWVAAGGADGPDLTEHLYPSNVETWFTLKSPLDLRSVQSADVEFRMSVETEPEVDYVFVGVSIDGEDYEGEYWSGDSGGWQEYILDLNAYLGYEKVYVAWFFYSDEGNEGDVEYAGIWVDDITAWTYHDSPPPSSSEKIQNGDFETGDLSHWTVPAGSSLSVTNKFSSSESSGYAAWLGGIPNATERFYQQISLDADPAADATLSYLLNQFGTESEPDADRFCVWLSPADNPEDKWVDLGCMDGAGTFTSEFDPAGWWQVDYTFTAEEWEILHGKAVNLVFDVQTNGSLHTTYLVDDVSLTVSAGGAAGDAYEPNDTLDTSTPFTVGETLEDLTIAPDGDLDTFSLTASAGDTLVVDIDADSNGSPLDSLVAVLDKDGNPLCENDDANEDTKDSYLTCPLPTAGDYFVQVRSYDGSGDRNSSYRIYIDVISNNEPTPTPEPTLTPTPTPSGTPPTHAKKWTAILYLDGDNNLCGAYPELISDMEKQVAAKIGPNGFLNIAVLFDAHPQHCNGQSKTIRYLIQPDGQYTQNINRWDMGEVDMGDPQTLINFATWAMTNYPADHYYMAIDNHGGGLAGAAWDDSNGDDNLTNAEIYAALKQITDNGARKIDLFAYEACNMGLYENAYDLHEFVHYLYLWPTISFTANTYPAYLGAAGFTATSSAEELGKIMFDAYYANVTNPYVLSLIDASKLPALHQAVDAWATVLLGKLASNKAALTAGRTAAQKIDSNNDDRLTDGDLYLDLWDLAEKLKSQAPNEATALQQAISAATVKTGFHTNATLNYNNAHALTIFWPQVANGDYSDYTSHRIYQPTTTGKWRDFLTAYFGNARGLAGSSLGAIDRQPATPSSGFTVYLPMARR